MLKNRQQVVLLCAALSLLFAPYSHSGPLSFIKNLFIAKEHLPKELTKGEKIILMVQHVMLMQELKGLQKELATQGSVSKALEQFEWKVPKITADQLKSIIENSSKADPQGIHPLFFFGCMASLICVLAYN